MTEVPGARSMMQAHRCIKVWPLPAHPPPYTGLSHFPRWNFAHKGLLSAVFMFASSSKPHKCFSLTVLNLRFKTKRNLAYLGISPLCLALLPSVASAAPSALLALEPVWWVLLRSSEVPHWLHTGRAGNAGPDTRSFS